MALRAGKQQDRFPSYHDGDVNIIITPSRRYTLHSNVLENNSPVLRELLRSAQPARVGNNPMQKSATTQSELVLTRNPHPYPAIEYILQPAPLDGTGGSKHGNPGGVENDLKRGNAVPDIFAAFDAVLGAFYNIPINIGDSQDDPLADLLSVALDITVVAEYLDCVHVITNSIEACLQATGQDLYQAISRTPLPWLSFAYRVRSKFIFREALIHAAGKYNTVSVQRAIRSGEMPEPVVEVLHRKGEALTGHVRMAERHFASYYPTVLMREKTVGRVDRDNIGRANYGNDIIMWISLCVFRHWCADQMAADMTHHAADMGYGFIKAIHEGGNAYLSRHLMQTQFHQRFPMSPKGMACVEHRLSEVKENVKQWATPLLQNGAQLDIMSYPVKYFTCTSVCPEDYPWEAAAGHMEGVDGEVDSVVADDGENGRLVNRLGEVRDARIMSGDVHKAKSLGSSGQDDETFGPV